MNNFHLLGGLEPRQGAGINKTRPCVVVFPLEMNTHLWTIIMAPVTSKEKERYPTRVKLRVDDVDVWIILDQIRSVDKARLCEDIGSLTAKETIEVKSITKEMLVD